MPAFQVGILAEWRQIPWDQRHGVRLSFYVFLQICLVLVMATMRLEKVDANAGNARQIEPFVGTQQSLFIETQNVNKIQAVDVSKDSIATGEMKKKHAMPDRVKKKANAGANVEVIGGTFKENGLKKGFDVKPELIAGNVDAKTTVPPKRLKRDDGVPTGDSDRKIESCAEGCALIINQLNDTDIYSSTIKQYLGMCYPSLKDTKEVGFEKFTARFRPKQEKRIDDNLCDICNDCDKDRANWHGIRLDWEKNKVSIQSSLWEGSKFITEMVKDKFDGNVSKFLEALFDEGSNIEEIFKAEGQCNLLDNLAFKDGAFFQDFNGNDNEAINLLHKDISTSLNYVNMQRIDPNPLRIWLDYLQNPYLNNSKNPYSNYTLDQQKRLQKCHEEVDAFNREAGGENRYQVYEYICIMNETEKKNLYGEIPIPPNPDGQNQTWGGSTATGPLPYPKHETIEDERKKYNSFQWVERPEKYSIHNSNRTKRQNSKPIGCKISVFDVREKFSRCAKYINNIRDQNPCSTCWAVSTASALTDRSCIFISKMRPNIDIDYDPGRIVSARDAMECSYGFNNKCNGGNTFVAWKYYVESSTVNEHCKPYVTNGAREDWEDKCNTKCDKSSNQLGSLDIMPWKNSFDNVDFGAKEENIKTWNYNKKHSAIFFKPTAYHHLSGGDPKDNEELMKQQLEEHGPIVASFNVYDDFQYTIHDKPTDIYKHSESAKHIGAHAVRLIGYGALECEYPYPPVKEKFWLAANSWGERFGNKGLFYITRGINECSIESSSITWGVLTSFPYSQKHDGKN